METNTPVSKTIDTAYRNPKLDEACKKVLSFKIILAHILKGCLEEFKDIDVNDIAEKYIEGKPLVSEEAVHQDEGIIIDGKNTEDNSIDEGMARYDILFDVCIPVSNEQVKLIINIEAQSRIKSWRNLLRRARYYCARMLSHQYGREFVNSEYENIKKVISIWVLTNPYAEMRNTITRVHLAQTNLVGTVPELKQYYDTDEVVLVCLGGEKDNNYSGLLKMLDVLFSESVSIDAKKQVLENEYDIKMSEELQTEVYEMCDYSLGVYDRGVEKGIAQGMAQGAENKLLENIKSVMEGLSMPLEKALELLKVPKSDYDKYEKLLK